MTKAEYEKNWYKMAPFKCENGRVYMAFKKSCVFCENCDLFWDYTNGPYMFLCRVNGDPEEKGLSGECELFQKEAAEQ